MVGVGTVLADDPLLTCRLPGAKSPVRIVCDTHLRTPPDSRLVKTAGQFPTILATCCREPARQQPYQAAGCEILCVPEQNGRIDLAALMELLGQKGIDSILLEGGGTLHWAALQSGIVQKVQAYIAPKLLGGQNAKTPIEGQGVPCPDDAFTVKNINLISLGKDFLLEGEVVYPVHRNH